MRLGDQAVGWGRRCSIASIAGCSWCALAVGYSLSLSLYSLSNCMWYCAAIQPVLLNGHSWASELFPLALPRRSKDGKTVKLEAPLGEIPLHMLGGQVSASAPVGSCSAVCSAAVRSFGP